jgi:elongation factor P--beta-lysine ligase
MPRGDETLAWLHFPDDLFLRGSEAAEVWQMLRDCKVQNLLCSRDMSHKNNISRAQHKRNKYMEHYWSNENGVSVC